MYLSKLEQVSGPQRQKGLGLPATVFIITVLALIVVAISNLTRDSNLGFAQNFQAQRAFYAAESGAQVALNRIFVGGSACSAALADIDFNASGTNAGLESCSAALSCSQVTVSGVTYYTIDSIGTCGSGFDQAQRQVQVRASDG